MSDGFQPSTYSVRDARADSYSLTTSPGPNIAVNQVVQLLQFEIHSGSLVSIDGICACPIPRNTFFSVLLDRRV
jgi:hypothetical protein